MQRLSHFANATNADGAHDLHSAREFAGLRATSVLPIFVTRSQVEQLEVSLTCHYVDDSLEPPVPAQDVTLLVAGRRFHARGFSYYSVNRNSGVDCNVASAKVVDERGKVRMIPVYGNKAVHVGRLLQQLLQPGRRSAQQRHRDDHELATARQTNGFFRHGRLDG